jgi:hypothetical protein
MRKAFKNILGRLFLSSTKLSINIKIKDKFLDAVALKSLV